MQSHHAPGKRGPTRAEALGIALVVGAGVLTILLGGCAGGHPAPIAPGPVFPPHRLQPISVAVTEPVRAADLQPAHAGLMDWSDSPGQRRQHMACVWQTGADGLMELAVPGTDLACFTFAHSPLPPPATWLATETDSLGRTVWSLTDPRVLDRARYRGWSHLVVPLELKYGPTGEDSDALALTATAAVVDVLEGTVVWQGEIDGRQAADDGWLAGQGEKTPPLTTYARATYAWLWRLFDVLDRMRLRPETESAGLSTLCQEPPPVFSYEADPDEGTEEDE